MARVNNYLIQAQQAKALFLRYDQQKLIEKLKLRSDEQYLYVNLLCKLYRINRTTGDLERQEEAWVDANTFEEVLTLMDLVCDSRPDRYLSCRWKNMLSFGHMFHQNLLEERNPFAEMIQENQEAFRRACTALGGKPLPNGDIAYAFEVFDGLPIAIQFWEGDEEFPPSVRYMWDENALMYLRYETMYYAVNLLKERIDKQMQNAEC